MRGLERLIVEDGVSIDEVQSEQEGIEQIRTKIDREVREDNEIYL